MTYIRANIKSVLNSWNIYISRTEKYAFQELSEKIYNNILSDSASGILHIGAHIGQESKFYDSINKSVIWIEPIPIIFSELSRNIDLYPRQIAFNYLLGSENKENVDFWISSNNSVSSSIYKLGDDHGWHGVEMNSSLKLNLVRLDAVFDKNILMNYQNWVIDVQGAELDVLIGCGNLIELCQTLLIEVSARNTYEGGSKYTDVRNFLVKLGFAPLWEPLINGHENLIFVRTTSIN